MIQLVITIFYLVITKFFFGGHQFFSWWSPIVISMLTDVTNKGNDFVDWAC